MTELPEGFISRLESENPGMFSGLAEALTETAPEVSIRANKAKGFSVSGEPVAWCADSAVYLPERPQFTLDPALHQGLYYVQDASSMFIAPVARQIARDGGGAPLRWLDACAAPGGKTTCVADNLPAGSLIVANELVPQRAAALRENVIKWGAPSMIVTRADSRSLGRLRGAFDVVAADVPCSGEGMMRKDPDAVAQWSEALIKRCAALQREIVEALWEAVAPGGYMVYSTCTFNRAENEEMVHFITRELGGSTVAVEEIDPAWGITESGGGYRFIPGRTRGEGLFMALIAKPGSRRKLPASAPASKTTDRHPCLQWINGADEMAVMTAADRVNLFPARHQAFLKEIMTMKGIDVIHHGIVAARTKGRDLIPDHSLAMSAQLRPDAFPIVDLNRDEALTYLRCEPLTLPADTPRGHVLLTFAGRPLGFAKHLGNRTNSLYPKEWRIHIR